MNKDSIALVSKLFDAHGYSYVVNGREVILMMPCSDLSVECIKVGSFAKAKQAIGY